MHSRAADVSPEVPGQIGHIKVERQEATHAGAEHIDTEGRDGRSPNPDFVY